MTTGLVSTNVFTLIIITIRAVLSPSADVLHPPIFFKNRDNRQNIVISNIFSLFGKIVISSIASSSSVSRCKILLIRMVYYMCTRVYNQPYSATELPKLVYDLYVRSGADPRGAKGL